MEEPQLVQIKWKDAFSGEQGWLNLTEYTAEGVEPTTIGWLFQHQPVDGYIVIWSTFYYDGDQIIVSDPNHIPIQMITDMKYIRLDKPEGNI